LNFLLFLNFAVKKNPWYSINKNSLFVKRSMKTSQYLIRVYSKINYQFWELSRLPLQGVKMQAYRAYAKNFTTKQGRMNRLPKCKVIFEWALRMIK
jgi:hypothetical protein